MDRKCKLDTSKNYRVVQRVMLKEDGNDILAFDPNSLNVHQLNSSMAEVARVCNGELSCEQLVVHFSATFGLETEVAAQEVYRALKLLNDHDLLEAA